MGTVFLQTLRESLHRRVGVVLILLSMAIVGGHFWFTRFHARADGTMVVRSPSSLNETAALAAANNFFLIIVNLTVSLWVFLALFAVAPLLTSFLEKGWVELLLSKGVARWQVLLGRYLGSLGLFCATLLFFFGVPALDYWLRAGVRPWRFLAALALLVFSFSVLLALMALVAVKHGSPALPIMAAFLMLILSPVLGQRKTMLYGMITARWAQWLLDWAYRILPKHYELMELALKYVRGSALDSWWPVWSSAMFLGGSLGLAHWLFYRRSF